MAMQTPAGTSSSSGTACSGNSCTQEHVYKHPWELMVRATERRYPTHPLIPQQISSAVTARSSDGPCEQYTRMIVIRVSNSNSTAAGALTRLFVKMLSASDVQFEQRVVVDHAARRFESHGENVTMTSTVRVCEECTLEPHPENSQWCVCP